MANLAVYKVTLAVAVLLLCLICAVLYVILYRLDKLRYGQEDMQLMDHVVIVGKIVISMVLVSQLWLFDNNVDWCLPFFLVGCLLLFMCFRGSFREVRTAPDVGIQASTLAALLFASGACLALVYYSAFQIMGGSYDSLSLLLHRFFLYGGGALLCVLMAVGWSIYQEHAATANQQQSMVKASLAPAYHEDGRVSAFV